MLRSFSIRRLIRRQQSFVAIAVAIYAGLWAADRPADLSSTIIYTLPLCNVIALIRDYLTNAKQFCHRQLRDDATLIVIAAQPLEEGGFTTHEDKFGSAARND